MEHATAQVPPLACLRGQWHFASALLALSLLERCAVKGLSLKRPADGTQQLSANEATSWMQQRGAAHSVGLPWASDKCRELADLEARSCHHA